jgi:hypothetical protein
MVFTDFQPGGQTGLHCALRRFFLLRQQGLLR